MTKANRYLMKSLFASNEPPPNAQNYYKTPVKIYNQTLLEFPTMYALFSIQVLNKPLHIKYDYS